MSTIPNATIQAKEADEMEAELPASAKRTKLVSEREWSKTPNSIRLGLYLYAAEANETMRQELQVTVDLIQSKISELEILKAHRFYLTLRSNAEVLRRTTPLLRRALDQMVRGKPTLKETRRIGIGYRDKGSLRPSHKPRSEGEVACWSEDLKFLPPDLVEEPRMITAKEVKSIVGYDLLELLNPVKSKHAELLILQIGSTRESD